MLATAVASTLFCPAPLLAAPPSSLAPQLSISPLTLDVSLSPGETVTRNVTVTVGGALPLAVAFEHADFGFSKGRYDVQLIEDSSPDTVEFSTRDWFSVTKKIFRIPGGKSLAIPVKIAAPGNATPGTHLGAALFRTVPQQAHQGGTQIVTSARTGPLVFVTIKGGTRPKPRISKLSAPRLVTSGPVPVKLSAAVSGDGYVRVSGSVEMSGNHQHTRITFPEKIVIGGSTRVLIPEANLKHLLGNKSLKVGRYSITATLMISPTGRTLTRTVHVWLIPVWLFILTGVALLIVIVSIAFAIRRFLRSRRELKLALLEGDESFVQDKEPDYRVIEPGEAEASPASGEADFDDDSSLDDEVFDDGESFDAEHPFDEFHADDEPIYDDGSSREDFDLPSDENDSPDVDREDTER